ncbi:Cytochrome P450 [Rhypophila decipiens]
MTVLSLVYDARWMVLGLLTLVYLGNKLILYHRLSHFKGPFSSGWSELYHIKTILSLDFNDTYNTLCETYGSIVRVGPNDLLTSSPELLSHINSPRAGYVRSEWYHGGIRFKKGEDHVMSLLDDGAHTRQRARLAAGYSGKENLELESSIDQTVGELVHLIRTKYLSNPATSQSRPFDLAQKINFFTLDTISLISYGESFGDLRTDSDVGSFMAASKLGLLINTTCIALRLWPIIQHPWINRFLAPSEKDAVGMGRLISNARTIIEARFAEDQGDVLTGSKTDMIASFARHGLTKEEIVRESLLQIVAGSDTTSAALTTIMLFLLTHPPVYAKLQAEVDSVVVKSDTNGGSGTGIIPTSQAKNLPYLQAVIKEGTRIHPPVAIQATKCVPPQGDTVTVDGNQVFLPGGTNISVATWPLHFRPDVFSPDPKVFRPERWLTEKDSQKLTKMHQVYDLTFGGGKFQCLGKKIAGMELEKVLFGLIRNFDWSLMHPQKPWKETNYVGMMIHQDMWVLATHRTVGKKGY